MKKSFILLVLLTLGFTLSADCDFGVVADVPKSITGTSIDGVRFGLPFTISDGRVKGAELSLCYAGSSETIGCKFALIGMTDGESLKGAAVALINFISRSKNAVQVGLGNHSGKGGIQVGLVNHCDDKAKVQVGLLNFNRNGWMPFFVFFNFSK